MTPKINNYPISNTHYRGILISSISLISLNCSTLHKNPIPGHSASALKPEVEGVAVSKVLGAVKYQVDQALAEIKKLQEDSKGSPIQNIQIYSGTGTLAMAAVTSTTNGGSLGAIIPFSGFGGTEGSPLLSADITSGSLSERTFEFSIETKEKGKIPKPDGVEFKNSITSAIVGNYKDILCTNEQSAPEGVALRPSRFSVKFGFSVERSAEGSAEIKFVPTRTFSEVGGSIGGGRKGTYTHELLLSFSFLNKESGDKRELIYPVGNGQAWVKEPFDQERYDKLVGEAGKAEKKIPPQVQGGPEKPSGTPPPQLKQLLSPLRSPASF